MENPMAGEPIGLTMRVGGTKVELTAEAEERRKQEAEAAIGATADSPANSAAQISSVKK